MDYHDYKITLTDAKVSVTDKTGLKEQEWVENAPAWSEANCHRIKELVDKIEANTANQTDFETVGKLLYDLLFSWDLMSSHFDKAFQAALSEEPSCGLRIRLVISEQASHPILGQLTALPWSMLYHPRGQSTPGYFFGQHRKLALINCLNETIPPPVQWVAAGSPKLRVLVIASCPEGLGAVLSDQGIEVILDQLNRRDYDIELLEDPTHENVMGLLADHKPHIVHFLGHGRVTSSSAEIALVDEIGCPVWYDSEKFSVLLSAAPDPPKLFTLVACQGAARSSQQAFVGFAPDMVRAGVRAVVGMTYEVSNSFSLEFTNRIYSGITSHGDLAAAVQETRFLSRSLFKGRECGAPVLIGSNIIFPTVSPSEGGISFQELTKLATAPEPITLIGRDEEMQTLLANLELEGATLVWGEGGVGKSALVRAAATSYSKKQGFKDKPLWINCAGEDSGKSIKAIWRGKARDFLAKGGLAIFDALDLLPLEERGDLLAWFKEQGQTYRVLITSRTTIDGLNKSIKTKTWRLSELKSEDAIKLFRQRAQEIEWDEEKGRHQLDQVNELILALCDAVGNLPLAIEILASQTEFTPLTKLLKNTWKSLLEIQSSDSRHLAEPWHYSVSTCFAKTFDSLSIEARALVQTFCFVDSVHWLAVDAFYESGPGQKSNSNAQNHNLFLKELVNNSVWRKNGNRYTMHPLMRRYALLTDTWQMCPLTPCGLNPTPTACYKTSGP